MMKKYNFKIEKIGRKWIQCKDEYNRNFKVEINDVVTEMLKENDKELVVCGELLDKSTKYGVNREIVNITTEAQFKEKCEKAQKAKEVEKCKSAINKMLYYIETNLKDYWYKNGEKVVKETIETLKSKNIDTTKFENKLAILKEENEKYEKERKKAAEERRKYKYAHSFTDGDYFEIGEIVKCGEKYVKITDRKSVYLSRDDVEAMYGGYALDDYYSYRDAYKYTFENATDEEVTEHISQEEKKAIEKQEKQTKKENLQKAEKELSDYIFKNCIQEEKSDELEAKISNSTLVCEKFDCNSTIRMTESELLLLIPNWSDWDNWDYNNCKIGICKTCEKTENLLKLLDTYLKAKEDSSC